MGIGIVQSVQKCVYAVHFIQYGVRNEHSKNLRQCEHRTKAVELFLRGLLHFGGQLVYIVQYILKPCVQYKVIVYKMLTVYHDNP